MYYSIVRRSQGTRAVAVPYDLKCGQMLHCNMKIISDKGAQSGAVKHFTAAHSITLLSIAFEDNLDQENGIRNK